MRFGHPEILGLDSDTSVGIINEIGEQVKAGKSFVSDEAYDDIFADDVKYRFRHVQSALYKEYVCWSQWLKEVTSCFAMLLARQEMDLFPGRRGAMLKL